MKSVLLTTYPDAYLYQGGGEREITLLRDALLDSGIMAEVYGCNSKAAGNYAFAIHFSMVNGSEHIIAALAASGLRLILWPNLWFLAPPSEAQISDLSKLLGYFEAVVFRSTTEEMHFREYFSLSGKTVLRAAYLISQSFSRRDVTDVFSQSYGLKRYVIWPGIIEPQKNQLVAVRAFKDLPIDLVISGRIRDEVYAAQCRAEAGSNVHFIPPMPFCSEIHLSALQYSSLFIELPLDFPGTSAVEAAASQCRMLLSYSPWTEEVLGPFCTQVDPLNVNEIRRTVAEMLTSEEAPTVGFVPPIMSDAVSELVKYINYT